MNLHEYQAKQLFKQYGLSIPIGTVCNNISSLMNFASKTKNGPWILKCQVHAGGRSKSEGVKIVKSKKEIKIFAEKWFGNYLKTYQTDNNGQIVNIILIEEVINITKELYLGIIINRNSKNITFIASENGGVEIEKISKINPNIIHKLNIDLLTGPLYFQGRELAFKLGLNKNQINKFIKIFIGLSKLFLEKDLLLVEVNPLAINTNGDFICLDGKINVDNNALFRQKELRNMYDESQENIFETKAIKLGLSYVSLNGNIGCIVNGAGLAMSTMDIIKLYGGSPANFLDVGGNITENRVIEAFKIIISNKKVKAILVNIFGGIVRCDLIANGIITAVLNLKIDIPIVVRFEGNKSELGNNKLIYSNLNIISIKNLNDAIKKVILEARNK